MSCVQKQKWEPVVSSCPRTQNLTVDRIYEQPHQNALDRFLSRATQGRAPSVLGMGRWELDSYVLLHRRAKAQTKAGAALTRVTSGSKPVFVLSVS